jgi:hypothetical protein
MKPIPPSILRTHPHIAAILENAPQLEVESSRSGSPTARVGERSIHSRVNPCDEARRFLQHWLATEGVCLAQRMAEG